jgi:SAM-dependent methyltransferase
MTGQMNCNPIARYYRWLEYAAFGLYLERSRFRWIDELIDAKRVLILGDGDGRFLARLATKNTEAMIDGVELSSEMLRLTRRRLERVPSRERIRLIQDDALTTSQFRGPYDLVVTHFFLDCLDAEGQRKLIEKIGPAMAHESRWLVTDFRIIESARAAPILRAFTKMMYWFFEVTTGLENHTLVDFSPQLTRGGFRCASRDEWLLGYLVSDIWERQIS